MIKERKIAKEGRAIKVQGVQAKGVQARREHKQPYATEVEDYTSDAVNAPAADPRRETKHATGHGDVADRLRPLIAPRRRKAH